MSITGAADGPPYRLGVAIGDIVSGVFAAQGVLLALLARGRTGQGQLVDVGMLDSVAALLTYQAGIYFATGSAPRRIGNRHPTIVPYETFAASDGEFVIAVGNDEQWRRFCSVAGLDPDERFATNRQRVTALRRAEADSRRTFANRDAPIVDRPADRRRRAVRIGAGSGGSLHRSSTIGARDDRQRRPRHDRRSAAARHTGQAVRDAGFGPLGPADARPAHGCGLARGPGLECGADRRASRSTGHLRTHGNLGRQEAGVRNHRAGETDRRRAADAHRRGGARVRRVSRSDCRAVVPADRRRAQGRRPHVHRLHPRWQRAADVRPLRRRLHRAGARHHRDVSRRSSATPAADVAAA